MRQKPQAIRKKTAQEDELLENLPENGHLINQSIVQSTNTYREK